MKNLDDELVCFSKKFLGYGNLDSPTWFVGMEEGGGNSKDEVIKRIQAWTKLGRNEVCDISQYHYEIGEEKFFREKPSIQKTWGTLIKLHLGLNSKNVSTESIRHFQRDKLGRIDSDNALIELMPLPSPKINTWHYDKFSDLPFLKSREKYLAHLAEDRVSLIKEKILKHKPKTVIFYSFGYLTYWQYIAINPLLHNAELDCYFGTRDETNFLVIKHPSARTKKGYIERISELSDS